MPLPALSKPLSSIYFLLYVCISKAFLRLINRVWTVLAPDDSYAAGLVPFVALPMAGIGIRAVSVAAIELHFRVAAIGESGARAYESGLVTLLRLPQKNRV